MQRNLLVLLVAGIIGLSGPAHQPAVRGADVTGPGALAPELAPPHPAEIEADVSRDERYRTLLRDVQRFQAIWQQQPENRLALERELSILRQHIAKLRPRTANSAVPPTEPTQVTPTLPGSTPIPAGPVTPVQQPTPEEIFQQRIAATENRFLPGRPLDGRPRQDRSLAEVPDAWIAAQCELASRRLDAIERAIGRADGPQVIDRLLLELEVIVSGLDEPPPADRSAGGPIGSAPRR